MSTFLTCQKQPSCHVFLNTLNPIPYEGYLEISSIKLRWPAPSVRCFVTSARAYLRMT
eukprot:CAMPEP_0185609446 /NCGR_PEP_ID=MMETSP0436-20130131/9756_2 /TAXON_ID=626734 ORGANISM="Favella taraikaensis, Strain Fe Narragansett Bay" /NCGR_SAMPLE_ID=MMETSP0436 /ASSEMBLY_ACC=CAM_ASM_000390 /LENGTH=57 /DNA_ID=CAMNT_0028241851 /DNA_START=333 /DNA_END=502 /DNA_ORIENTATION=-